MGDMEVHVLWQEALAKHATQRQGDEPRRRSRASEMPTDDARALMRRGVPPKHRHDLWLVWFVSPGLGDIEQLQAAAAEEAVKQIDLDIPRTNPGWLQDRNRVTLGRVLRAYAAHKPEVGYCQGMNFIVMIFIILGFEENIILQGLRYLL